MPAMKKRKMFNVDSYVASGETKIYLLIFNVGTSIKNAVYTIFTISTNIFVKDHIICCMIVRILFAQLLLRVTWLCMGYGNCVCVSMVTSRVWLMAKFGSMSVESKREM